MSAAAIAAGIETTPRYGLAWNKTPEDMETWTRAERRVYRVFMRWNRHGRREHALKNWVIAKEIGEMEGGDRPHRRTVQRGVKGLHERGIIERLFEGARGRIIRMKAALADAREEKKRKKQAAANKDGPRPVRVDRPPRTTSERVPAPEGAPIATDEPSGSPATMAEALEQIRRQTAEAKAHRGAEKVAARLSPVLVGLDFEVKARSLTAEQFDALVQHEARGFLTSDDRRVLEVARRIRDS